MHSVIVQIHGMEKVPISREVSGCWKSCILLPQLVAEHVSTLNKGDLTTVVKF